MADVVTFARERGDAPDDSETAEAAAHALERGSLLFFPHLPFAIANDERGLFSPEILTTSKNASFDPATGTVGGTMLDSEARRRLQEMMARFSGQAERLVRSVVPRYRDDVQRARASFRPAE